MLILRVQTDQYVASQNCTEVDQEQKWSDELIDCLDDPKESHFAAQLASTSVKSSVTSDFERSSITVHED